MKNFIYINLLLLAISCDRNKDDGNTNVATVNTSVGQPIDAINFSPKKITTTYYKNSAIESKTEFNIVYNGVNQATEVRDENGKAIIKYSFLNNSLDTVENLGANPSAEKYLYIFGKILRKTVTYANDPTKREVYAYNYTDDASHRLKSYSSTVTVGDKKDSDVYSYTFVDENTMIYKHEKNMASVGSGTLKFEAGNLKVRSDDNTNTFSWVFDNKKVPETSINGMMAESNNPVPGFVNLNNITDEVCVVNGNTITKKNDLAYDGKGRLIKKTERKTNGEIKFIKEYSY